MEHRRIFVTLDNANDPQGYVWALQADPADFDDEDPRMPAQNGASVAQRTSWASALTEAQVLAGWTAVPSEWRRVPSIAQFVTHASGEADLTGRTLRCGGVTMDMDERGDARGGGQEPNAPRATLVSLPELQALVDALGESLTYQEAGTGDFITTDPT